MDLASKKLSTSVNTYCRIANAIPVSLPYGLEEHDLSVTSEVELKDEVICTPAEGVARSKGTASLHPQKYSEIIGEETSSQVSCVQR